MNIRKIGVRHIEIVLNKLLDKSSKAIFTKLEVYPGQSALDEAKGVLNQAKECVLSN